MDRLGRIAPTWSRVLLEAEDLIGLGRVVDIDVVPALKTIRHVNITDPEYCIVGETWGMTSDYDGEPDKECKTCMGFSMRFLGAIFYKSMLVTCINQFCCHVERWHPEFLIRGDK